jgi:hypothetical protein
MSLSSHPGWSSQKVRAFACFVLIVSFLFNPYAMTHLSSGGLNVAHPASHRATVGSSELEKYWPLDNQNSHWVAVLPLEVAFAFSLQKLPSFPAPQGSELFPTQPLFCASLWFRPPPAQ